MRKKTIKTTVATGLLIISILPAARSQNMNNPYSVYGVGDIDNKIYNRTSGMGGTGVALRSSTAFIDNNPASIAGLPRSFYMAHVSFTGKTSTYSGGPIDATNSNNKDFWIKRLAMAVKINGFWASSIGFGQFSNVNYKFSGSKFVEGSNASYETAFEGDGGLNNYYWTNAVSLGKHLSIGIKSSIIAGAINQSETLNDASLQTSITTKQQDYIGDAHFQGGFIYEHALSKKWDFSIGGKFAPRTRLSAQRSLTVTENDVVIQEDEYVKADRFFLPQTFGGGIALKKNKKITYAADYTYEDWSALKIKETGWQLISSNRISAGIEVSNLKNKQGKEADYKFLQVGGFYNNSYLQIRNTPINEYGITGGMGGLIGNNLLYTLSLEAGVRGTKQAKLIKETYVGVTINLTYSDFLFSKGRKYD